MSTQAHPPVTCKCGGQAIYIGTQDMGRLGYSYPMYNCLKCDSSMGGARVPHEKKSNRLESNAR